MSRADRETHVSLALALVAAVVAVTCHRGTRLDVPEATAGPDPRGKPSPSAGATVAVTAGASAPEHLVQNLIARLQTEFGGEVEQRTLVEEDVFFDLPKSAKSLAVIG